MPTLQAITFLLCGWSQLCKTSIYCNKVTYAEEQRAPCRVTFQRTVAESRIGEALLKLRKKPS